MKYIGAGSKISYFVDNDLLLPQLRHGSNDSKNHSEGFRDIKNKNMIYFGKCKS